MEGPWTWTDTRIVIAYLTAMLPLLRFIYS